MPLLNFFHKKCPYFILHLFPILILFFLLHSIKTLTYLTVILSLALLDLFISPGVQDYQDNWCSLADCQVSWVFLIQFLSCAFIPHLP